MESKFGCNISSTVGCLVVIYLQRLFANEHWTEAGTKSDMQVENLINITDPKLILWESYITTKLKTDYYNNQSQVYIMYVGKLET